MDGFFLRQRGKWRSALSMLLPIALLPACIATAESPPPGISSTRGTTLVRSAVVIGVRDFPAAETASPAHATAGNAGSTTSARLQEITVQFEDGQIQHYQVGANEQFVPGERLTLRNTPGKIHIDRQQ